MTIKKQTYGFDFDSCSTLLSIVHIAWERPRMLQKPRRPGTLAIRQPGSRAAGVRATRICRAAAPPVSGPPGYAGQPRRQCQGTQDMPGSRAAGVRATRIWRAAAPSVSGQPGYAGQPRRQCQGRSGMPAAALLLSGMPGRAGLGLSAGLQINKSRSSCGDRLLLCALQVNSA